ncbi:MAG: helix-turn-helix domain-containing protein [Variovorax sp.]|nr:MAG: helix-turn-helix domain-containing protein [Variovorax sp.]
MSAGASSSALPVVAILVTPDTTASVVYGMFDLFKSAGRDWGMVVDGQPGPPLLEPMLVGAQAGTVHAANGVTIEAQRAFADGLSPAVVCVPELLIAPTEPLDGRFEREVRWVRSCHAAGALVATACSGAVLLAEAGLLDGEDATTHWAFCDMLQHRYPRVRVRPQRALVAAGEGQRLVMAGGGSSWMDLALYLIARCVGIEAALQVAKLNLIDWHHGGQQPFARVARARQMEDAVIGRCQSWIADNYAHAAPVAAMIGHSGLAERSFQRRFKLATGMTPMAYVQTLRIEEAKHLLETTEAPVEVVAGEVGYDDAAFFGRLFRRSVSLTPAQYRRRFGGLRAALAEG